MNSLVVILIGCLFPEAQYCHHHTSAKDRGKKVWEFGKDTPQSLVIMNREATIDEHETTVDFKVPRCHRVIYTRVEVDNPFSTPQVTTNLKSVTIKYKHDQAVTSSYRIIATTGRICDTRFKECMNSTVLCSNSTTKKNEVKAPTSRIFSRSRLHTNSSNIWEFGKNFHESFTLMAIEGMMAQRSKGIELNIKVSKCQQVVYIRVEVHKTVVLPEVTTNTKFKTIRIMYDLRQNKSKSLVKILVKAIRSCDGENDDDYNDEEEK